MLKKSFNLNHIDSKTIQIFGEVNGYAKKRKNGNGYDYQIIFFDTKKRMITISNNEGNGIRDARDLEKRIINILEREA